MHVTDALITTEGALLARGSIEFEPDPSGLFVCPPHQYLIIDRTGPYQARIIPAEATRDEATGLMRARALWGALSLPLPLDQQLRRGLARLVPRPTVARADHLEGSLGNSLDPCSQKFQRLSHCILATTETEGSVEFAFEADLRAIHPFEEWEVSARNHWGIEGPPARLSASFRVDSATRWVACGAIDVFKSPVAESDVHPFDGHEGVRLERWVGYYAGSVLAGSPGGPTWLIYTGSLGSERGPEEHLWLRAIRRLDRRQNGLFEAHDKRGIWNLRCNAFTLEQVVRLLRPGETLELFARGGRAATAETGYMNHARSWDAESVSLSATAAPAGLSVILDSSFEQDPWLPDPLRRIAFTVPRETLLTRYPREHLRLYGPL